MGKFRLLHILVIVYLVTAFTWWAILLYSKNQETYQLQKELATLDHSKDLAHYTAQYEKQKKMILGEGVVFGLSILFGLFLINRAYTSEINTNNKLNSFLLSVTHELKTPIASLQLANKTLQRSDLNAAQRSQLLATCNEECQRLESQVENILAAAQLEQVYKYNPEATELKTLISKRIRRHLNIYPNKNIVLKGESVTCRVDVEAMTKVIDNLLHNAIKYSNPESTVVVSLKEEKKSCKLSFANEGKRISDKEKKRIWEKFYRIGNEETRDSPGTGLGLWIVQSIVKAHGGVATVSDNKPSGSIFHLSLPL